MISFKICLAESVFKVDCLFESTKNYCRDYLSDQEHEYEIMISDQDMEFERSMDLKNSSERYLEILALYRKIAEQIVDKDVILFHSSALELDGDAYVFSAPSGTGKSTHSKLWMEHFKDRDIHMINDDKPLLKVGDQIRIYGTPWMGKDRLGENISAQVKAICFINQGKANRIRRMNRNDALTRLIRQTYRPKDKDKVIRMMVLLNTLNERIPIYDMDCDISMDAVRMAYEYMKEGKDETER